MDNLLRCRGYWQKNATYGTYQQWMTERWSAHDAVDILMLDDVLSKKKKTAE